MKLKLWPIFSFDLTPQEWCVCSTDNQGYADGQLYWWPWTFVNNLVVAGALTEASSRGAYKAGATDLSAVDEADQYFAALDEAYEKFK